VNTLFGLDAPVVAQLPPVRRVDEADAAS